MIEEIDNGFKFRQENFVVLHENVLISFIVCHLYLHSVSFFPSSQLTARSFLTRHLWELLVTEHVPGLGNQYCTGTSHVETPDVQKAIHWKNPAVTTRYLSSG